MRVPIHATLLMVAFMATGIASPFIADLLYDWGANYGAQFFLAFLELIAFVSVMQWRRSDGTWRLALPALLTGATVLIGATSNSSRALTYQFAPFVVGLVVLWLLQRRTTAAGNRSSAKLLAAAAALAASFAVGSALNHAVVGNAGIAGLNSPRIYPANDLMPHLSMTATSVLFMLGVPLTTWANLLGDVSRVPLLSFVGVWLFIRIVIALFLVWAAYFFIRRVTLSSDSSPVPRPYAVVATISLLLVLLLHVFAFRYPKHDYESARYIFGPLMIVLIGTFMYFSESIERILRSFAAIAVVAVFLIALAFMNNVYPGFVRSPSGASEFSRTDKDAIVACLERAGLRYGYGSLWLAHVFTVLSDSRVVVRPVFIDAQHRLVREPMHMIPAWYEPGYWTGPTFLLVDQGDLNTLAPAWQSPFGAPSRIFMCGNDDNPRVKPGPVHVFVYPYNIGPRLGVQ
jgi:hypothetical protein